MSSTVTTQYYADRYTSQDAPQPKNYAPESYGAAYETGVEQGHAATSQDDSDLAYLDSFESEEAELGSETEENLAMVAEFEFRLEEIAAAIESDPELKSLKGELSPIKLKLNEASNPQLSEPRRRALLGALDAMMTELDAAMANSEPVHEMDERVAELKKHIEAEAFPAELSGKRQELLSDLEQVQAALDLKADSEDIEAAELDFTEIEERFAELKDQVETDRQEAVEGFTEAKDGLLEKIRGSEFLRDKDQENFISQVEAKAEELLPRVESGELKLDEALKEFDEIDYAAGAKERKAELSLEFENLTRHIGTDNHSWEKTKTLAGLIAEAVASGDSKDWKRVKTYLNNTVAENDEVGNDLINGLLGALYYRIAEKDEDRFKELLDLIPADIRSEMRSTAMASVDEQNDYHGTESEAEKDSHAWFGSALDSDQALANSLRWSRDSERRRTRLGGDETLTDTEI
jgi:hypothetical protein